MNMLFRIGAGALLAAMSLPAMAQVEGVTRAVGPVTEVWVRDARYSEFHKELAGRFADVPELQRFMASEQWISVMATRSMVRPVVLKARIPAGMEVAVGDIVDIKAADNLKARSYSETSIVTAVACKKRSADFDACSGRYPSGMWNAANEAIEVKRR